MVTTDATVDDEVRKKSASGLGRDLESSEALELGIPPRDVQMEEVGKRVTWGLAIELALEGPPLAPLTEAP